MNILVALATLECTLAIVINHIGVKLRPNEAEIVEYIVNEIPFGFIDGANLTLTVTCVSLILQFIH